MVISGCFRLKCKILRFLVFLLNPFTTDQFTYLSNAKLIKWVHLLKKSPKFQYVQLDYIGVMQLTYNELALNIMSNVDPLDIIIGHDHPLSLDASKRQVVHESLHLVSLEIGKFRVIIISHVSEDDTVFTQGPAAGPSVVKGIIKVQIDPNMILRGFIKLNGHFRLFQAEM